MSCTICGHFQNEFSVTSTLKLLHCKSCRHTEAQHLVGDTAASEYHYQYEQGEFLDALAETRNRQAKVIVKWIEERNINKDGKVLDYGCGRGWFLKELRRSGFKAIYGADLSSLATRALVTDGIPVVNLAKNGSLRNDFAGRFHLVCLLDVLEHVPASQAVELLRKILATTRPDYLLIKVPDSRGLLYRVAMFLKCVGRTGPLEQLYQVGTAPPHFHYFSENSMCQLMASLDLKVLEVRSDLDFEPPLLLGRIRGLKWFPRPLGLLCSRILAALAIVLKTEDSKLYLISTKWRDLPA